MGEEWEFTSIFGIPKSFARRKTELARKNFTPLLSPPHKAPRGSILP